MKLKSPGASGFAVIVLFLAGPAFANIAACASGNLSTIDNTTCDIGNLQFTFTGLGGSINSSGVAWMDSDFTFNVLPNGFELSGPPPQTITGASLANPAHEYAELNFRVTDPVDFITGINIAGGNPFALGSSGTSFADNFLFLQSNSGQQFEAYNKVVDLGFATYDYLGINSGSGLVSSGFGYALPFELFADLGDTAGIDSTTTSFIFDTGTGVPEPSQLAPLSIGVLGLLFATRGRLKRV